MEITNMNGGIPEELHVVFSYLNKLLWTIQLAGVETFIGRHDTTSEVYKSTVESF